MWTVDARCSNCGYKATCEDRNVLYADLSPLVNHLNSDPLTLASPGDGIIVLVCNGFALKAPKE